MNDQMRNDFEAWFLAYRKSTWRPAKSDPRKDMPTHWNTFCEMDCWRGWQAATLAERDRCALVCESHPYIDNGGEWFAGLIRQGTQGKDGGL